MDPVAAPASPGTRNGCTGDDDTPCGAPTPQADATAPCREAPLNPGGSFLRDRLANERTLLAWVRTALTLIALGLALAKLAVFLQVSVLTYDLDPAVVTLLPDPRLSQRVAAVMILLGGVIAAMGGLRTMRYAAIIDPEQRQPDNRTLLALSAGTVLLALALLLYVLSRG